MDPKKAYKFCPRCGTKLEIKDTHLLKCGKCGFNLHINPAPTNGVIIENKKGEILLVKRAVSPKKGFWDLPGGFIDPGEDLKHSVKREIKEELGIEIKIKKLVGNYPDQYLYEDILYPTFTIVVSAHITKGKIEPADDVSGYKFFKKDHLPYDKIAFKSIRQALIHYLKERR